MFTSVQPEVSCCSQHLVATRGTAFYNTQALGLLQNVCQNTATDQPLSSDFTEFLDTPDKIGKNMAGRTVTYSWESHPCWVGCWVSMYHVCRVVDRFINHNHDQMFEYPKSNH